MATEAATPPLPVLLLGLLLSRVRTLLSPALPPLFLARSPASFVSVFLGWLLVYHLLSLIDCLGALSSEVKPIHSFLSYRVFPPQPTACPAPQPQPLPRQPLLLSPLPCLLPTALPLLLLLLLLLPPPASASTAATAATSSACLALLLAPLWVLQEAPCRSQQ